MGDLSVQTMITIHKPEHRRRTLASQQEALVAADAYDRQANAYFEFLGAQAGTNGLELRTDARDSAVLFTIDEPDHERKKAAHDWYESQPGFWDWLT